MSIYLRIIDKKEADRAVPDFDSLGYSQGFGCFQKRRYGLDTAMMEILDDNRKTTAILPINFALKEAYGLYKDYVEPSNIDRSKNIDWSEVAKAVNKEFGLRYTEFSLAFASSGIELPIRPSRLSCFVLRLEDGLDRDMILAKANKKTRNEVRKSEKYGFDIRLKGTEAIDEIYQLYAQNMERHGTPPKSKQIFADLFDSYGKDCAAMLAYKQDELAGINIAIKKGGYLRLAYNFSLKKYWDQCINNFLYHRMIADEYADGVRIFDFGPSSVDDKSHNHFKIGFGARQIPIYKITEGSILHHAQKWIRQKRYNMKLRINKLKK